MRLWINVLIVFVLWVLPCTSAAAQNASDQSQATGSIDSESWERGETHVYDNPGEGYSVSYEGKYGFGTVYIYDFDQNDWKDGIEDPRLSEVLMIVAEELKALELQGRYRDLIIGEPSIRRIHGMDFHYLRTNAKHKDVSLKSVTLLAVRNRKLLKFRISFPVDSEAIIDAEVSSLVEMVLKSDIWDEKTGRNRRLAMLGDVN